MKSRLFILIALILLIGLVLWALVDTSVFENFNERPQTGTIAPDFELPALGGKQLSLRDLRGKVVMLNFWATWCPPCLHEMPSLEAMYQKYKDRGLIVVGVNMDEEGWPAIKSYLKKSVVTFPILSDHMQRVSDQYGVYRVPETYLIDAEGRIVDQFIGPKDYNEEIYHQRVEEYLAAIPNP